MNLIYLNPFFWKIKLFKNQEPRIVNIHEGPFLRLGAWNARFENQA